MNHSKQAKVIVATDRTGVPDAVHAMLTLEFDVVSVVYDAGTLLSEALRVAPDLVVIEAALSLRDEFRAIGEIMRRLPRTKIIHHASDAHASDAGIVVQDNDAAGAGAEGTLAGAVRLAGAQRATVAKVQPCAVAAPPQDPSGGLTTREREVLELLASGVAMKVIAHRLGITYRTVAFHKYKMMQRLGIRTNAGLTTYALRSGALGSPYVMGAEFAQRPRRERAAA
jgi:DNA-binding NarL/FixJ family response regulator